jgi:hypothetical protein
MDTITKPITRVRMADSGGISTLIRESLVSAPAACDDASEVRLPERPYRIVMHCRNTSAATRTAQLTIRKR